MFYFTLRRFSVLKFDICVWTIFGPLFPFTFPSGKRGGGGRGFFSGQRNVPFQFYEFSRIYLVTCSVTPYLNQVFRRCFSMENLRAYVDDGSPSPSVQTTVTTRSTTSTGLSTSSSSSTTSSSVPSTRPSSGPVQDVVTHTSSPAVVPTDKTVSLKDLPPPPPPDEPVWTFPSPCGLSNGGCFWWFPAACRRRACTAAATAIYGGHTFAYPLPKVWGHCLGLPSFSSRAQDTDASPCVVLCASPSTVDLVRTGP